MTDARIPQPTNERLDVSTDRRLGELGMVGPVAFGCWRLVGDHSDNSRVVHAAVDLGMNLLDNADVYGLDWGGTHFGACEEALGRVLRDSPALRNGTIVATKGGIVPGVPYESGSAYLQDAVRASLRRLGTECIDLYQIHRPDHFTHPAEVASAFDRLHSEGLVRAFGVSNFGADQTRALLAHVDVPFVSTQPEVSAIHLDALRDGTLDLCTETGLVPLAWSPLAGGRLATGEGVPPALIGVLDDLAARESVTRSAIAVAFVLAHPSDPVAIVGTQRVDRLSDVASATRVHLTRSDAYRIIEASDGRPLP